MAVGDYLFRLLKCNATVDVERGVPSLAGGTQYTWSAVASGVNVLVSQAAGSRDLANGVFMNRDTYTVAGVDPSLARSDVRFKVTATSPGLAVLVDRYLIPTAGVGHSQGVGGILGARINRGCVLQEIEANDGSEL